MARIVNTFVTKSNKCAGQNNYRKFKVTNLLLREDLLNLIEINNIVASGQKD
jgi:hypothetical protein